MADNRMFLVHKPTMIGINLGKRFGSGWYCGDDNLSEELNRFYDYIASNYSPVDDDFILLSEIGPCATGWRYSAAEADGFIAFELDEPRFVSEIKRKLDEGEWKEIKIKSQPGKGALT